MITKIINKVTSLSYSNDEMIKKYKFNIYDSFFFHFQKLFESNELANVYLLVKTLEYMLSGIKRLLLERFDDTYYIHYVEKVR